jgi:hydrogenase-4 component F
MEFIIGLQLIWAVVSYFLNLRFIHFVQIGITFINLILGYSLISKINNPQDRIFELNNLLFLDSLNSILLLVILTISFFVSVYSIGYMKRELKAGISEKKGK